MPRLTGPLFSLEARGRLGGLIDYRQLAGVAVASAAGTYTDPATPAQLAHRDRVRDALTAWHSETPEVQAQWATYARPYGLTSWAAYWREYFAQLISPPNRPVLPPA